jgi:hypothetical protein
VRELGESQVFKQQDSNCHQNALVGAYFSDDLELFAEGYYRAAALLVSEVDKGEPSNILVYPICFLYRHFVEIALKEIIARGEMLRHSVQRNKAKNHGLSLDTASKLVKEHLGSSFSDEAKRTIQEISNIDATSQFFRYTTSRKGNQFIPDHYVIGLGALKKKMVGVHDELMGAIIGLGEYLEIDAKIDQEYAK